MYELRKRVRRFYFYGRNPRIVYFVGNRILCFLDLISGHKARAAAWAFLFKRKHMGGGLAANPPFWRSFINE